MARGYRVKFKFSDEFRREREMGDAENPPLPAPVSDQWIPDEAPSVPKHCRPATKQSRLPTPILPVIMSLSKRQRQFSLVPFPILVPFRPTGHTWCFGRYSSFISMLMFHPSASYRTCILVLKLKAKAK